MEKKLAFDIVRDTEYTLKHWHEYDALCDGCAYPCKHDGKTCGLTDGSIRCKKKFIKEQLDLAFRHLKQYFNDKYFG